LLLLLLLPLGGIVFASVAAVSVDIVLGSTDVDGEEAPAATPGGIGCWRAYWIYLVDSFAISCWIAVFRRRWYFILNISKTLVSSSRNIRIK
jgi:hypothetical protein